MNHFASAVILFLATYAQAASADQFSIFSVKSKTESCPKLKSNRSNQRGA